MEPAKETINPESRGILLPPAKRLGYHPSNAPFHRIHFCPNVCLLVLELPGNNLMDSLCPYVRDPPPWVASSVESVLSLSPRLTPQGAYVLKWVLFPERVRHSKRNFLGRWARDLSISSVSL
jgi:hypothetical protein